MKTILITGGAGFIGSNTADYYLAQGHQVIVLDNLSRANTDKNLAWLQQNHPDKLSFEKVDVRDSQKIETVFKKHAQIDIILHFAAQVAVTTSVINPREDMEINIMGTFNLLEATRKYHPQAIFVYTSTNKVYGGMEQVEIVEKKERYQYKNLVRGVSESDLLDFHSPYGCSKGAADQYVRDYHRIYGLKTIVFRQSCIYGIRQFGVEDQGWVAWFTIAANFDKHITIYGDGKQVRDVLFISDLIAAYDAAIQNIAVTSGQIYNIGGGSRNQMSVLELVSYLEKFFAKKIKFTFANWRPGDQKVFVADITKAKKDFGWEPEIDVPRGVEILSKWIQTNSNLFT